MTLSASSPTRSSTGSSPSAPTGGRTPCHSSASGTTALSRFCTGPEEQKQHNLDANQHVAVTTGTTGASGWSVGKDIVVEGTAVRVTAAEALQALADAWYAKYGDDWRFEVRGEEFVELSHSGGSTEGGARVYRVKPDKVIAFGDAHGQTTYRF
jgi:hypothetical protein